MMPEKKKEFLHSYYLILISIIAILILLFNLPFLSKFLTWLIVLVTYFKNGLKFKRALNILLIALLFSSMFVLLGLLYPAKRLMYGEMVTVGGVLFYKNVLWQAFNNFVRIFFLSHLSMSSSSAISYTKVILYLIVNKKIKPSLGYPLLVAINSIDLFKEEFIKIRISTKYRLMKNFERIYVLFPLLVFAIRQAQRGAMSLVTRGLSSEKSYYFNYEIRPSDKQIFSLLFFLLAACVSLAIVI